MQILAASPYSPANIFSSSLVKYIFLPSFSFKEAYIYIFAEDGGHKDNRNNEMVYGFREFMPKRKTQNLKLLSFYQMRMENLNNI